MVRGADAVLPMPIDTDPLVRVLAVDPSAVRVALGDPGVRPVARDEAAARRRHVDGERHDRRRPDEDPARRVDDDLARWSDDDPAGRVDDDPARGTNGDPARAADDDLTTRRTDGALRRGSPGSADDDLHVASLHGADAGGGGDEER